MKKQLIFLILFLISSGKCFSCICIDYYFTIPNEEQLEEYDFIAHVFIVKDGWVDGDTIERIREGIGLLEIEILELFKGDTSKYILEYDKHSSCELGINANEEWLIFSQKDDNGQLIIAGCDPIFRYRNKDGELYNSNQHSIYALNELKEFYNHEIKKYDNETIKSYYRNGQIELIETYKNGELDGERKVWYPNGQIMISSKYNNGELEAFIKYFVNGQVMFISQFIDGKRNGKSLEYFENGQIRSESLYYNDEPIGISKTYYELDTNSINRVLLERFDKTDTLNFLYNTIIVEKETIYDDKGNRISNKNYDRLGNLEMEGHHSIYSEISTNIHYYPNGQIREINHYKKGGKGHGRYQRFHENGSLDNEDSYNYDENGKRIKKD